MEFLALERRAMSTDRERKLARALKAALRWPYATDMLDHLRGGVDAGYLVSKGFDYSYIADMQDIHAGVQAAQEIDEPALSPERK